MGINIPEGSTAVFVQRHGCHYMQAPTEMARIQANAAGRALERAGVMIDVVLSSTQLQCVGTAYATVEGNRSRPCFYADDALADVFSDPRVDGEIITGLLDETNQSGTFFEETLLRSMLYRARIIERGGEAARYVERFMGKYHGKTILVTTHGSSPAEVMMMHFQGRLGEYKRINHPIRPGFILGHGHFALMTFTEGSRTPCVENLRDVGAQLYQNEMTDSEIADAVTRSQSTQEHPAFYGVHVR